MAIVSVLLHSGVIGVSGMVATCFVAGGVSGILEISFVGGVVGRVKERRRLAA